MLDETVATARLERLRRAGILPILRGDNTELLYERACELIKMGYTAIEVTLDSHRALEVVAALRKDIDSVGADVLLGVGTMTDSDQAQACAEAGAEFVLSPSRPPEMIPRCHMQGLLAIPGVSSAEEWAAAKEAGAYAVKLFPISNFETVDASTAPTPWMPVGGIKRRPAFKWLEAGAFCVGMGQNLCGEDIRYLHRRDPVLLEQAQTDWRRRGRSRAESISLQLQRRREP